MKGTQLPDTDANLGNVEEEDLATNQEGTAVPLHAGEARFALVWLSDPFGQFTREAPAERPGKK